MRLRAYQRHRPDGRPRPLAAAAAILMVASLASAGLRRRGESAGANGAEMGSTLKLAGDGHPWIALGMHGYRTASAAIALSLALQRLVRRMTQPRRTPDA